MPNHTVFFVSDGTGITAETFGNSILAQFAIEHRHVRRPFIDTIEKAEQVVREINAMANDEGRRPIVFLTLINETVRQILSNQANALVMDMFQRFIEPLEAEFGIKSNHRVGRFSDVTRSQQYHDRIEAINFSLAHDDGQSSRNLSVADVILVGVSRSGKTPTSLYLAMQHGIKAANYPLIPDDFERGNLPSMLAPYKRKCFGLTIDPDRLSQIRNERRPGSKYAALANCRMEINEA
ncbi:MAG: pyruvate, water dikinase regulatory protein, partial [Leptothrix ochracea]